MATNYELFKQRKVTNHAQCLCFAILCAEAICEVYHKKYPEDNRVAAAVSTAKQCLNSLLTRGSIPKPLRDAADAAAYAAYVAANAAYAANAANAAANAANAANAATNAANAATYAAANAVHAATYAATYAANAGIHIDFEYLADKAVAVTNTS